MTIEEFKKRLRGSTPVNVATSLIQSTEVAAFASSVAYQDFRDTTLKTFPKAESVHLVGSGNWGYSLDPKNLFRPFSSGSDLDVAIVSAELFAEAWEELRRYHRTYFYKISADGRDALRRNGENVYAGFIAPVWIPESGHPYRFAFVQSLNRVAQTTRTVNRLSALYFKNMMECVDYYSRGIRVARKELGYEL